MTPELLAAAAGCSPKLAERYARDLSLACSHFQIDRSPARLAMFLAQIGHESAGLAHVVELWGPTDAQQRYEGRRDIGNTQPGDGSRYRGRGLIQITGRANYADMRDRLRQALGDQVPDFEANPEKLELPAWAAWSAAAFWHSRSLNSLADAGEVETVTRKINGGLNGLQDRIARLTRAQMALAAAQTSPEPANAPSGPPVAEPSHPEPRSTMPIPAFVAAALPLIIDAIPKLGKVFGSGSQVAERNIKAAEVVVEAVKAATGATTEQEAVQRIQTEPAMLQAATQAVEQRWLEITEAGGGGLAAARQADAAARAGGPFEFLRSPSWWALILLLPLVYIVVLSLVGIIGTAEWSDDVRAGLAGSIVSAVIGGAVGYFWGQVTSRNRGPAP